MPNHVVLLSGGLDSTVALGLACWRTSVDDILAVGVHYGQRHINELEHARYIASIAGVAYVSVGLDPAPWKLLPLLTGKTATGRTVYAMKTGGVSDAFLPGRNVALLTAALMVAGVQNASHIWIGANADDAAGFPDCRPAFLAAWEDMASRSLDRRIILERPLLTYSKPEIAQVARRMAIDIDATWSCYRPIFSLKGATPCGRCDACVLRAAALNGAG